MNGKIAAIVILVCSVIAGVGLYYLQIYGFYEEVATVPGQDVVLLDQASGVSVPITYSEFRAIDADSRPIRYRACFTTSVPTNALVDTYVSLEQAVPRNAPGWFECFQAEELAAQLSSGTATAFVGIKNIRFGVDRLVAITNDGRGFAWHELNDCGAKAYDGTIVGEECPQRPPASESK